VIHDSCSSEGFHSGAPNPGPGTSLIPGAGSGNGGICAGEKLAIGAETGVIPRVSDETASPPGCCRYPAKPEALKGVPLDGVSEYWLSKPFQGVGCKLDRYWKPAGAKEDLSRVFSNLRLNWSQLSEHHQTVTCVVPGNELVKLVRDSLPVRVRLV